MSEFTRKAMADAAGLTVAQATVMSGADLEQAVLAAKAATAVGPGLDGARLTQIDGE